MELLLDAENGFRDGWVVVVAEQGRNAGVYSRFLALLRCSEVDRDRPHTKFVWKLQSRPRQIYDVSKQSKHSNRSGTKDGSAGACVRMYPCLTKLLCPCPNDMPKWFV